MVGSEFEVEWSEMRKIRIAPSARRHRIGSIAIVEVLRNGEVTQSVKSYGETRFLIIGVDQRGRAIEVVSIEQQRRLLVIHAMPVRYRCGGVK
jgi:uncharacterized DUF497 family protein